MKSGRPTFDSIPDDKIVNWRSEDIVEVSLGTAVRYLHSLEKREESVSAELRQRTDLRRETIYEDLTAEARVEMETLRKKSASSVGPIELDPVADRLGFYIFNIKTAWIRIVDEELLDATLEDSKNLRE